MTIVNKIFKSIHCVHISNNVIKIHSMYVKCLAKFPKHIWRAPYVHEYLSHKRGGILCLLLKSGRKIITILGHEILSTLKEKFKNLPPPMPHDLCMFKFMIMLALCFPMGKAHQRGMFPKCEAGLRLN